MSSKPKSLDEALRILQSKEVSLEEANSELTKLKERHGQLVNPLIKNNFDTLTPRANEESGEAGIFGGSVTTVKRCGGCCSDGSQNLKQYLETPVRFILLQRLPWLIGLMMFQSVSAMILNNFEHLLAASSVITFFLPMVVGTGGNAGNQPGVMITRALGAKEVTMTNLKAIFIKEGQLGMMSALALGFVAFIRVLISTPSATGAATAIGVTIFIIVLISVFLGLSFSLLLERLRMDPADSAALLLTSLADMIGISILCGVSVSILKL